MTPEDALEEARAGSLRPVYVVVGEEPFIATRVLTALRTAALDGATPGLNDEQMTAGEATVDAVLSSARTLPMFCKRRLVVVKAVERWEGTAKGKGGDAFERLTEYLASPTVSTVLILSAAKLDKRRRLYTSAQKAGCLVSCEPLSRGELPRFVERAAKARGNTLAHGVAELIAELAGPELSRVSDALERVCLFVGEGAEVTEDAVAECVVRVRPSTVWELVDAVGRRDAGQALSILDRVYDPQDRGLRLVGVLAWSARQLLRFEAAVSEGARPEDAAKRAGAAPFKARELAAQVKSLPRAELEQWLLLLAGVDGALKGGSKRPPRAVLEYAILSLCRPKPRRSPNAMGHNA